MILLQFSFQIYELGLNSTWIEKWVLKLFGTFGRFWYQNVENDMVFTILQTDSTKTQRKIGICWGVWFGRMEEHRRGFVVFVMEQMAFSLQNLYLYYTLE